MNLFNIFIFLHLTIISIINQSCNTYVNYCRKCNILTNLCILCENDDIFIPDTKGGCTGAKKCIIGKNYCNECNIEGKLCIKCDDGFYPDENGGCSSTNNCKISYKGQCIECKDNYIILGSDPKYKYCKSLLSNDFLFCEDIDLLEGECKRCKDGFFLGKGDKKCIEVEFCYESIFGNCVSCINGYYLNKKENKCLKMDEKFEGCKETIDGDNCEICDEGYYFDENGICTYSNFCSETKNRKCIKCKNSYYLTNDSYCSDSDNCFNADKDTGLCTSCNNNYYLDINDYKCKSNLENIIYNLCIKVKNEECVKCQEGYILAANSQCGTSSYCAKAENGKCVECFNNFYLGLDHMCTDIIMIFMVERCIYSYNYQCIECEDNYYYNKFYSKCLEAKEKFANCKMSNDYGIFCIECKNGFYLDLNNSLCYKNITEF